MKNNINGFPGATQVVAEIEALYQEIADLKKYIKHVENSHENTKSVLKSVLFDLLEEMKNADSARFLD